MKDVFVVCRDQEHFNLFYANFKYLSIHFSWAKDLGTAFEYLEIEQPNFVFLVSEDKELLLEWIERYQNKDIEIPFLCFTGYANKHHDEELWKTGAIDIIYLPVNIKELEYILSALILSIDLEKSPDLDTVEGRLEDFNLIHLIQTFEDGGKSGVLILEDSIKKGEVEFINGDVVNAQYSNRDPLDAIMIMSTWKHGTFRTKQKAVAQRRRIAMANQQIIIECLNYISTQEKLLAVLPPREDLLYASPKLDFEELSPRDRNQLLAFRDGNTLEQIMTMFTGDMNQLLKKMAKWNAKNWLLKKSDYDRILKKVKNEEGKSSLKKMMEKMFSKLGKEEKPDQFEAKYSYLENTEIILKVSKKQNQFVDFNKVVAYLDVLEAAD
jgi:ActR/RegA family two-component response regulator